MEELKDTLDQTKWVKLDVSKKPEGFKEFQVMRQHKKLTPTSFRYLIQMEEDEDPKGVTIEFTVKDKDPLKNVGTAELLLEDNKILAVDLDGDCYQLK
ncbi:hypothetical protein ACOMHN_026479 [Nucella lapillus]